jgi:HlyD family secretion protein
MSASWFLLPHRSPARSDILTHRVKYETLEPILNTHGTLESAQTQDIVCHVKSRIRGSTLATTINWVMDEGSLVHHGDRIIEFDSSGIQEDLRTEQITLLKAKSDWEQAEQNCKIVKTQNKADIETAGFAASLADIDLEKYVKGDYVQAHDDVVSRLSQAECDKNMSHDRVAWSERMLKKGFVSHSQVHVDQARQLSAEAVLENVRQELRVLEQYTRKATLYDLESKAADAHRTLECVKSQAQCKEMQARIDRQTKQAIYEQEQHTVRDLEEQIQRCTVTAPCDGTVVYVSQQRRYGRGSQQSIVAQGEPVREGQTLLQITDFTQMSAEILIPESFLNQIHAGREVLLQAHAFADQVLRGRIKRVANYVSQYEWWMTDTHVYPAEVTLTENFPGLKSGMTADATVILDPPHERALAVPLEALLNPVSMREANSCRVQTDRGVELREVNVGLSTDTMAEIRSGLSEGDEVILNP